MLIRTLAVFGEFDTVEAESMREAVILLSQRVPDLMLLDLSLGNENGFDLLTSFKSSPLTESIPIIICSAHNRSTVIERAESLGASGFVGKPISAKELREQVLKVLAPEELENDED